MKRLGYIIVIIMMCAEILLISWTSIAIYARAIDEEYIIWFICVHTASILTVIKYRKKLSMNKQLLIIMVSIIIVPLMFWQILPNLTYDEGKEIISTDAKAEVVFFDTADIVESVVIEQKDYKFIKRMYLYKIKQNGVTREIVLDPVMGEILFEE